MGTVEWSIVTIVGFLAGIGLGFWVAKLVRGSDQAKLADTEAEFAAYREKVTEHFGKSAEHFRAIGQQYRELYAHMAVGSEKLCELTDSEGRLRFPRPEEVVLAKASAADQSSAQSADEATTADAGNADGEVAASEPVDYVKDEPLESTGDDSVGESADEADTESAAQEAADADEQPVAADDENNVPAEAVKLDTPESVVTGDDEDGKTRLYH